MKVYRCGVDLAKRVIEVRGLDEQGAVTVAKTLARDKVLAYFAQLPACPIGMEACASAHYWAQELTKLGHTVRLIAA